MAWSFAITERAERDLSGINRRDREALERAFERLPTEWMSMDFRKLGGRDNQWRLRVGRWRAIVHLDNATGVMSVLRVLARDRAYRD